MESNSESISVERNSDSNSNSNYGNSNSIPIQILAIPIQFQFKYWQFQFNSNSDQTGKSQFNSNSNSGIGIGIGKQIQFRTGIGPSSARVTPVYKGKGTKTDEGNYCPISVIGHVAKILERVIQKQLMSYLKNNKLISTDQSAYMEHHNTQTALHNVTDDWYYNMTGPVYTGVCSLDIKKCFDTINHKILLEKMELYGFQPGSINWFESYLTGRQQSVFCQNVLSCKRKIQIGIPQGSVLGPVLFLLYVNDINRHVSLAACSLYADDTLLYMTSDTIEKLQDNLQECICEVEKWYN